MNQITTADLLKAVAELQESNTPVTYTAIANHLPHNMMTGNRFSREAIRLALQRSTEGREIYSTLTRKTIYTPSTVKEAPIIVEEEQKYFGGVQGDVVPRAGITQQMVNQRYVYGDVSMNIARYAKGVFVYDRGGIYLCKATVTRIRGKED